MTYITTLKNTVQYHVIIFLLLHTVGLGNNYQQLITDYHS